MGGRHMQNKTSNEMCNKPEHQAWGSEVPRQLLCTLASTELGCQFALCRLNLNKFVFALIPSDFIKPCSFILIIVRTDGCRACTKGLEAFVEEMGIFLISGRLFCDLWDNARL
jgi:hypothetical protein